MDAVQVPRATIDHGSAEIYVVTMQIYFEAISTFCGSFWNTDEGSLQLYSAVLGENAENDCAFSHQINDFVAQYDYLQSNCFFFPFFFYPLQQLFQHSAQLDAKIPECRVHCIQHWCQGLRVNCHSVAHPLRRARTGPRVSLRRHGRSLQRQGEAQGHSHPYSQKDL